VSRWFVGVSAADGPRYYRQDLPLRHLGKQLADAGIEINFSTSIEEAFDADVCVFSRCIGADILSAVVGLRQAGKVIVWDTDDDLTIPERYADGALITPQKEIAAFVACLDLADVITVSVPHLSTALGREHKTIVLPNMIDLDDNPISEHDTTRDAILYCGTSTHHRDIELFRGLYERTCKRHPWIFVGIRPKWMHDSSTFIPLPPVQSYYKVCRLTRPLFALAPLTIETFNLSKSPIKIWETATLGAHVVASNYGPYAGSRAGIVPAGYEFDENDLFAARSTSFLHACVREAIENSWQGSRFGPKKWLDAFLSIEDMVHG